MVLEHVVVQVLRKGMLVLNQVNTAHRGTLARQKKVLVGLGVLIQRQDLAEAADCVDPCALE